MKRTAALAAMLFFLIASSGYCADKAETKEAAPAKSKQLVSADSSKTKTAAKKTTTAKAKAEAKPVKKGFELPDPDPALVKLDVPAKSTQGTVTGKSVWGMAVEYGTDKKDGGLEIWFNFSKGIKLVGLKELKEIEEGDTVSVTYKTGADNHKLITEVALIEKKPKEAPAAPEPEEAG